MRALEAKGIFFGTSKYLRTPYIGFEQGHEYMSDNKDSQRKPFYLQQYSFSRKLDIFVNL